MTPVESGASLAPSRFCGFLGKSTALCRCEGIGASATALQAALATKGDGGGVFGRIDGSGGRTVLDLAGENVAYQLAKLDGIAGAAQAI